MMKLIVAVAPKKKKRSSTSSILIRYKTPKFFMLKLSRKSGSQDSSLLGRYTLATGKQLPTFRNVIVPSSSNSPRRAGLPSRVRRTYLTLETNTSFEMSEHVAYSLHIGTSRKTRILCAMCYCVISIHLPIITMSPLTEVQQPT